MITTSYDRYTPFGAASPTDTNIACQWTDDIVRGRGSSPLNTVAWTHYIEFADIQPMLDGCTRTASLDSLNYADGDEVRIPTGGLNRYVVVFVTQRNNGEGTIKRAYLLYHSIT